MQKSGYLKQINGTILNIYRLDLERTLSVNLDLQVNTPSEYCCRSTDNSIPLIYTQDSLLVLTQLGLKICDL